jgi:hypothetical protein
MGNKRKISKDNLVLILTLAVYILPVYADFIIHGWMRVFSFFAADTFYYLTIAKNYAVTHLFTFDGEHLTNGFHPLWQVWTGIIYAIARKIQLSDPATLVVMLSVSVACIATAIFLLGKSFQNMLGKIPVWFLLLPVGLYAIFMAPIHPRYGTLWSFTNGMESGPLILFYALLVWLMSQERWMNSLRSAVLTGLVMGVIVLSRLDHFFIVPAVGVVLVFRLAVTRDRILITRAFVAFGITGLIVALYLMTNQLTMGIWMPVSGAEKTTFPSALPAQLKLKELKQFLPQFGQETFGANIWRYTQIIFPLALSIPVFICSVIDYWKNRGNRMRAGVWLATSLTCLLLGLYNFLYVPTLDQGHWYFPVSILFMSMVFIHWLARIQPPAKLEFALGFALLAFCVGFNILVYRSDTYNYRNVWFYQEAANIRAHYAGQEIRMLEYDDGIITYSTGFTGMSALGFSLDVEALQALRERRLLGLAYQRGYRYIASHYYFRYSKLTRDSTPEEIKTFLSGHGFIGPQETAGFKFAIDYASDDNQFVIIRFEKE